MLPKAKIISTALRLAAVLCCALLICTLPVAAQSQRRNPSKDIVPSVGTIKDYPATGLMTGCGNLYFYPATRAGSANDAYIFLARGDGDDAWMNLNGRDVRLRQIRMSSRENRKVRGYYYRFGKLRISVVIEDFKPENAPVEESDSMFKMTITLRQGRAVRIVRAVGGADC